MENDINNDFKKAIIELMQISKHKIILRRMKIMNRLLKNKKRELDNSRKKSSSTSEFSKTLYSNINT